MVAALKKYRRFALGQWRLFWMRTNLRDIRVGSGFFCHEKVYVSRKHKVRAGKNLYIGRCTHFASHVEIGDDVLIASNVAFVGDDHNIDNIGDVPMRAAGVPEQRTTIVEDNVWIGHGSIILSGVTIKTGAVVAAGSVVTKDVEENSIVAGNYAKEIRKRKV